MKQNLAIGNCYDTRCGVVRFGSFASQQRRGADALCLRARLSIKFFRIVQLAYWRMGSITDGKNFFVFRVYFVFAIYVANQYDLLQRCPTIICVFVN